MNEFRHAKRNKTYTGAQSLLSFVRESACTHACMWELWVGACHGVVDQSGSERLGTRVHFVHIPSNIPTFSNCLFALKHSQTDTNTHALPPSLSLSPSHDDETNAHIDSVRGLACSVFCDGG